MSEIKIINAKKIYHDIPVIENLNVTIPKGSLFTILGPSGCGKTTLLRMIAGFNSIEGGEFYFDDTKINNIEPSKRNIGMVFQNYELFDHMNVIENIVLGPVKAQKRSREEVEKEAEAWLEKVGLKHKKYAYPKELSGGQKQRIAIVRALCMRPEIMLFDEITASLDPEIVREVLDVVINLAKEGMTMLIVTHEMGFARSVANRIVFMDEGKIVEESEPEAFFTHPKSERAKKFLNLFSF